MENKVLEKYIADGLELDDVIHLESSVKSLILNSLYSIEDEDVAVDDVLIELKNEFIDILMYEDDIFSEDEVEKFLDENFDILIKETIKTQKELEASWVSETDNDKLTKVFNILESKGIVAREDFTCCSTCGHYEMGQMGNGFKGYVFYHNQDTERARENGKLYLAYGCLTDNSDEATEKIGNEIKKELENVGFEVKWNGTASEKPSIFLNWKQRLDINKPFFESFI